MDSRQNHLEVTPPAVKFRDVNGKMGCVHSNDTKINARKTKIDRKKINDYRDKFNQFF